MFVHTVIMVIEPHMKQGRQHKLISTIFLATSVTKKLDHNKYYYSFFISSYFCSVLHGLIKQELLNSCYDRSLLPYYTAISVPTFTYAVKK